MEKIISLFARNYDGDRLVRPEIVPGAEFVIEGKGIASRKYDGTCCLIDDAGELWKRYDAKAGRTPPDGFVPAQEKPDPVSGHWPGWLRVSRVDPADCWHRDAFEELERIRQGIPPAPGTYELIGPKIQGNPERSARHVLLPHGADFLTDVPSPRGLTVEEFFIEIRLYLREHDIEGIVWKNFYDPGRMVKIKGKDFGVKRGAVAGV
jgi:hypothetical protein